MDEQQRPFTLWRGLRLSSFQIGSAMGEILITSIWNRILIVNFGIPATPVGLLIALRYLLSPLSLWAGNLTDNRRFFGLRRTPMIWLGRVLMVGSLPFLGLSVTRLEGSTTDPWGWTFALISSLAYGVGTLISGGPFLALVRESAPERLQGVAISMAQTVLIVFFAVAGFIFSFWMQEYDPRVFWEMIIVTMIVGGFFWFLAIVGIEQKDPLPAADAKSPVATTHLAQVVRTIWSDRRTRLFFVFLSLGTLASWSHEAILEPFGANVFNLGMDVTTRFNSYWLTATVLTLVIGGILWRKRPPEAQQRVASFGLLVMALGLVVLVMAAVAGQRHLLEVGLLVFGGGFGVYTYGGVALM
ncbi:MAG: MFS transporter, partial [Candidatus Promineofilum sp.]|nr:MFS transporter [Promineifilum sp.]